MLKVVLSAMDNLSSMDLLVHGRTNRVFFGEGEGKEGPWLGSVV